MRVGVGVRPTAVASVVTIRATRGHSWVWWPPTALLAWAHCPTHLYRGCCLNFKPKKCPSFGGNRTPSLSLGEGHRGAWTGRTPARRPPRCKSGRSAVVECGRRRLHVRGSPFSAGNDFPPKRHPATGAYPQGAPPPALARCPPLPGVNPAAGGAGVETVHPVPSPPSSRDGRYGAGGPDTVPCPLLPGTCLPASHHSAPHRYQQAAADLLEGKRSKATKQAAQGAARRHTAPSSVPCFPAGHGNTAHG